MQLTRCIHRLATTIGAKAATSCNGRSRTWREFADRVSRQADALRGLGVNPGDRVAILSLNSDYYLESFFAVLWAGGSLVPLNTRWAIPENQYALDDSGTSVLIVDDNFSRAALELQQQCDGGVG
jgi:acyl-CoA synthetase (AMP-forming)/AMP-acid ligase II